MIRAIIFDCFGVLAEDGWQPLKRKYIGANEDLAREVADLGKQTDHGMLDRETHLKKVSALMGISVEELAGALGKRVPNEELFAYIVRELKQKYKIGLMSNANYDVLHDLFSPDQAEVFDASVMSFESQLTKPDPRMYELMASRLGVLAYECLYVDDQERYCMAAEEYGMKSVFYQDNDQCRAELAELLSTGS